MNKQKMTQHQKKVSWWGKVLKTSVGDNKLPCQLILAQVREYRNNFPEEYAISDTVDRLIKLLENNNIHAAINELRTLYVLLK